MRTSVGPRAMPVSGLCISGTVGKPTAMFCNCVRKPSLAAVVSETFALQSRACRFQFDQIDLIGSINIMGRDDVGISTFKVLCPRYDVPKKKPEIGRCSEKRAFAGVKDVGKMISMLENNRGTQSQSKSTDE
jgi:hypothetical protein